MSSDLHQALNQHFGYSQFRTGQHAVIQDIMQGQSAAAIFPTGAGKSMCYQLPAVLLPHLTLVISPLLALIKDQVEFLNQHNISAASIDSTQDKQQIQQVMQQVKQGDIKVLMISVERLKSERFREFISQVKISLLVIDEAHCISEWGHNFRPDYLKLPQYRQLLSNPQVLLLTATATPAVIQDMQNKFVITPAQTHQTGFYRDNLDLQIRPCSEEDKSEALLDTLRHHANQASIVYVTLQNTAEQVAQFLSIHGFEATAYHAGIETERRQQIQQDFMQGQINCIVATIAFGMGIDKSDIRHVIHYDLPKSIENYAQEIGRAGRDGQLAHCTVLGNADSLNVLENFIYGDTPDSQDIIALIESIYLNQSSSNLWEVMLSRLSRQTHIRQLPLKTLLVYLELQQIIAAQYSYNAEYRFKTLRPISEIIQQFQGERQNFVSLIFQCSPKAKTWHHVDFDAIYLANSQQRSRVIAALGYLDQQGWISLEAKQNIDVYKVLSQVDAHETAQAISTLFEQKEKSDIQRIQSMLALLESKTCLSARLAQYFGDHAAPEKCGHCSVCRGQIAELPKASLPPLEAQAIEPALSELTIKAEIQSILLTQKAKTRFLCGLSTPLSTKLQATKLQGFGLLEAYPFAQVHQLVIQSEAKKATN